MIWNFQLRIANRLLLWAKLSIASGFMAILQRGFWRGLGLQFVVWGLINALIALMGKSNTQKRRQQLPDHNQPHILQRESRNLRGLLWINIVLDLFYILGGSWLASRNPLKAFQRGNGWGIILQGAFLFCFDLFHAKRIPKF